MAVAIIHELTQMNRYAKGQEFETDGRPGS